MIIYWGEFEQASLRLGNVVVHAYRTIAKVGLQHTSEIWCNSSCTNNHNKLADTSIHVLCNAIVFAFVYSHSMLGWYDQPCLIEWNGHDYSHSVFGWYGQPCDNGYNGKV